jgi:coenzyme F420 hydrogenase subunit beta
MFGTRKICNVTDVALYGLCQGCGACRYACRDQNITLYEVVRCGTRPMVDHAKCISCGKCLEVCSGWQLRHDAKRWPKETIRELAEGWGPIVELWEGYAADQEVRFRGGSGGVVTALAAYCLEREGMYGVLHVRADVEEPYLNRTVLSREREELVAGAGSRYAPASPCVGLEAIEDAPSPCVFVGKPCDVAAAQMARRSRPGLDQKVGLTVAIFCGGTPSTQGTMELLRALGVERETVADLRYRGHGWPGMTGVALKTGEGTRVEMTYREAWDTILTKHKPFRCHACPDGTGEFADIACGDPWYRPIQDGEKGSSLIVVRTELGRRMLYGAIDAGFVVAVRRQPETLPHSQAGLLNRRRHVLPKIIGLWLAGLPYPKFRGFHLWRGWLRLPWRRLPVSLVRALKYAWSVRRRGPLVLGKADIGGIGVGERCLCTSSDLPS